MDRDFANGAVCLIVAQSCQAAKFERDLNMSIEVWLASLKTFQQLNWLYGEMWHGAPIPEDMNSIWKDWKPPK